MSITAQGQVMVLALTIVAVCLAFVYRGWWSVVAGVHACLGVILMLGVGQPAVALFRSWPGEPRGCSFGWVRWDVGMSAWILAVATVFLGGGCRHQSRVDERNLFLPDPRGGYRHQFGVHEKTLGLPDPGGGCRHRSG